MSQISRTGGGNQLKRRPPEGGVIGRPISVFSGVIDQVGVSAQVAFGTRKLRTAYAGSALRVRRSSDNAELDIGFTASGDLNTTALLAHTGAGQGYVVTWYDQSGNGNDVTQATALAQPQIAVGGVAHAINGKTAINFDGLSQCLPRANTTMTTYAINSVHNPTYGATGTIIRQEPSTSGLRLYLRHETTGVLSLFKDPTSIASASAPTAAPMVATGLRTNGANSQLFVNGTSVATGASMATTTTVGNLNVGATPIGPTQYFLGNMAEVVVFGVDLTTTQRQTLERNQGTYFGITVA